MIQNNGVPLDEKRSSYIACLKRFDDLLFFCQQYPCSQPVHCVTRLKGNAVATSHKKRCNASERTHLSVSHKSTQVSKESLPDCEFMKRKSFSYGARRLHDPPSLNSPSLKSGIKAGLCCDLVTLPAPGNARIPYLSTLTTASKTNNDTTVSKLPPMEDSSILPEHVGGPSNHIDRYKLNVQQNKEFYSNYCTSCCHCCRCQRLCPRFDFIGSYLERKRNCSKVSKPPLNRRSQDPKELPRHCSYQKHQASSLEPHVEMKSSHTPLALCRKTTQDTCSIMILFLCMLAIYTVGVHTGEYVTYKTGLHGHSFVLISYMLRSLTIGFFLMSDFLAFLLSPNMMLGFFDLGCRTFMFSFLFASCWNILNFALELHQVDAVLTITSSGVICFCAIVSFCLRVQKQTGGTF